MHPALASVAQELTQSMGVGSDNATLGISFFQNYGGLQLDLEFDSADDIQEEYRKFFMPVKNSLGPKASRSFDAPEKVAKW